MKKIIIFFLFLLLFLLFFFQDNSYGLKIEIKIRNINPIDLDENYAKNIEKDILNLSGIEDVIIFSSVYGINIYCKFNYFSNREKIISEIERILIPYNFKDLKFNDRYYKKYNCFVIVHSKNNDYFLLKNKADLILGEILKWKISSNAKIFGLQQSAINIYLSDGVLLNYNLSLSDIKKIIKKNNVNKNFVDNKYVDVKISSLDDIENIVINYKNSNFPLKFADVFEIKKEIKTPPDYKIYWNSNNALVVALAKKWFCPLWLLELKLKDYGVEIINPREMKKSEIYLGENSNFETLYKTYLNIQKENDKNNLYFLALEAPKVDKIEQFEEIKNNRIIIFSNNFKYKNSNIVFAPSNKIGINYKINEYKINQFGLLKEDVFNLIAQNFDGVFCDYFYDNDDKIEVYLKNDSEFIYSKKFKSLILKDEVLKSELKNTFNLIARKNFKRIKLIKTKNPSKIRRVQFQIR